MCDTILHNNLCDQSAGIVPRSLIHFRIIRHGAATNNGEHTVIIQSTRGISGCPGLYLVSDGFAIGRIDRSGVAIYILRNLYCCACYHHHGTDDQKRKRLLVGHITTSSILLR